MNKESKSQPSPTKGTEHAKRDYLPHIMNISATMMGFCFIVLTTAEDVHISDMKLVDTLASIAVILFTISTVFSFLSFREIINNRVVELIADYVFLIGIVFVAASTIYIILGIA